MRRSKSFYTLIWMILLSLALGIFISYFFVFVNTLFISQVGTSQLPLAYVFSGIGGTLITYTFNHAEKKWGFAKASSLFCLFFAVVMFTIWYLFVQELYLYELIFFSYAWFWVSINFTGLVFWKLPSNIFNLSENKKYNGIISSGEVISAIIAYLSVPLLLRLDFFTRDKLLLISFFGISAFAIISLILGQHIKTKTSTPISEEKSNPTSSSVVQERYFQLLFLSIFLAVIVQLLIDFSLMDVSAKQLTNPTDLAQYFAFLYGGMRLVELLLKTFVSKYIVKEYGVLISLSTIIVVLGLIVVIGISSILVGYFGLILIVASLSKVFERSLYRSIYAPTINILYQAYPASKRALTQNYADGFGKTFGQLLAALLIFGIARLEDFESRVFIVLASVLIILLAWFIVSKKLINHYKIQLSSILKTFGKRKSNLTNSPQKEELHVDKGPFSQNNLFDKNWSVQKQAEKINWFLGLESNIKFISDSELKQNLDKFLDEVKSNKTNELHHLQHRLTAITTSRSKLFELFYLLLQTSAFVKTPGFNFHQAKARIRSQDFLSSALIQNFAKETVRDLSFRDFDFLIEDRLQKYTYLLASYRDLGKSDSELSHFIQAEINASKLDILYCLHFKYDSETLNQILLMLNQEEKNQELIALELMELVLDEHDKKWILPIFRESNHENILSKLEREFPQILMGKEKRLVAILANNTLDIPTLIKTKSLIELFHEFPFPIYHQLAATIAKNGKGQLQVTAQKLIEYKNTEIEKKWIPKAEISPESKTSHQPETSQKTLADTLSYHYWISDLNSNPEESESSPLLLVYEALYKTVFPMESKN